MENDAVIETLTNPVRRRRAGRSFMRELEHPADAFRHIGPNWFASVMGTGIVANAAILLPKQFGALHDFALGVWVLASVLLVVLLVATAAHWIRHPDRARAHISEPKMAPFYGAPPMAFLTVGAGTLLVGQDLIGLHAAVVVDSVLWGIGTATGLLACTIVPVMMFVRHKLRPEHTFATWLMPVVPPMVSASTGAALIAHLPTGNLRLAMLLACYSFFGLSLLLSLITITLVWFRLVFCDLGPIEMVPTLWIVLGPLGQSVTAVGLLGAQAHGLIAAPYDTAFKALGVIYGVPVWGFAILWLAIVGAITIRAVRQKMPFTLTWWSFTFPVGTVVTGTSVLATQTGAGSLAWFAIGLYAFLVCAWATAFGNTLRGAWIGNLFVPPEPSDIEPRTPEAPAAGDIGRTRVPLPA